MMIDGLNPLLLDGNLTIMSFHFDFIIAFPGDDAQQPVAIVKHDFIPISELKRGHNAKDDTHDYEMSSHVY